MLFSSSRYTTPSIALTEKEKVNILRTENEELKKEVRKYRYMGHDYREQEQEQEQEQAETVLAEVEEDNDNDSLLPVGDPLSKILESGEEGLLDEDSETGSNSTVTLFTPEVSSTYHYDFDQKNDGYNFNENFDDETIMDEHMEEEEELEEEEESSAAEDLDQIFTLFKSALKKTSKSVSRKAAFKAEKAYKVIETIKSEAKELYEKLPNRNEINDVFVGIDEVMFAKIAELQDLLSAENAQHYADATDSTVGKLGKALVQTLDKIAYNMGSDTKWLFKHWGTLKNEFVTKWNKIIDKYDRSVKKEEASDFLKEVKYSPQMKELETTTPGDDAKPKVELEEEQKSAAAAAAATRKSHPADPILAEKNSQNNYTHWRAAESSINSRNKTADWMFKRAQERGQARKEGQRSDWIFERAGNRKRKHEFEYATDWSLKKAKGKYCFQGEDGEMNCENLGNVGRVVAALVHNPNRTKLQYVIIVHRN